MGALERFRRFNEETWKELKRTSWPSKQEVYGTTLVVVVTAVIIAVFLGAVDLVLAEVHKLLFLGE